jgi:hypothetical protein
MRIPTLQQAKNYLDEAQARNPGPWVAHSYVVAQAAKTIATHHPQMNPDWAYILGYLHDIGRREGVRDLRHLLDGYRFLQAQGFEDAARICLTHGLPSKTLKTTAGTWDCSSEDIRFVQAYLARIEYTLYDKLIQLCDALALPSGFCLLEKRFIDVALRRGTTEHTVSVWQAYFRIQQEFEAVMGRSVYSVLPGVVKNTFGCIPQIQTEEAKEKTDL